MTNVANEGGAALGALRDLIQSGQPLVYLRTPEERRVLSLVRQAAARFLGAPAPVFLWSLSEGLRADPKSAAADPASAAAAAKATAPRAALDFIATYPGPACFILQDFHEPLRDSAEVRRRFRDLYGACFDRSKFVFVSSPVRHIPEELERNLVFYELNVPDLAELVQFLGDEARALGDAASDTSPATLQQLGRTLQGLTLDEASHAIRRALAHDKRLGAHSANALLEEKRLLVNRTGLTEFIPGHGGLEDIGGLGTMKKWLKERQKLFLMRDQLSADIVPKGVLVMGVSGCGKSAAVKAIASCFELPLYRIDMVSVFSGAHGKAEVAFAKACRMLESMSPAVVWFDEIEAGVNSQSKEGELGRMFAFFLTWMQEKSRGLFVGATANRIDLLPAEMIRKGRFDEVFFVDLPGDDERTEIFQVHLRKRGIDFTGWDFSQVSKFSKGWTGAEIEQCVISSLTTARLQDRALTENDLVSATGKVVPLSKTMKEQVDLIRNWAHDRAVRASPRDMVR
jgi:hypothetical protein